MVKLPRLTRDDLSQDKRYIYDEVLRTRGEVDGPFLALLHSPEVVRRTAHLGTYLRFESALSDPLRELVILTTAKEWECEFEWASHEPLGRKAGLSREAIEIVRVGREPVGLSHEEAVVIDYTRQVLRYHKVSDATFSRALEHLGNQGVTDLTATVGYYSMLACVLNTLYV